MKDHYVEPGRYKRQGFPEAVYGPGKSVEQMISISKKLAMGKGPVIVTRIDKKTFKALKKHFPRAFYSEAAGLAVLKTDISLKALAAAKKYICVVTAGTTDIAASEEAAITSEVLGNRVERVYDVGVAGVHRLLKYDKLLQGASCVVVCAGMEGALASVVGGLVACPVIGVPTSVGYGVAFGGVSALLSMLNSCAANVCTVNIDDGFGAGVIASLINNK